jgi:hypothetical protein
LVLDGVPVLGLVNGLLPVLVADQAGGDFVAPPRRSAGRADVFVEVGAQGVADGIHQVLAVPVLACAAGGLGAEPGDGRLASQPDAQQDGERSDGLR